MKTRGEVQESWGEKGYSRGSDPWGERGEESSNDTQGTRIPP